MAIGLLPAECEHGRTGLFPFRSHIGGERTQGEPQLDSGLSHEGAAPDVPIQETLSGQADDGASGSHAGDSVLLG
jgi:hypothetical protein